MSATRLRETQAVPPEIPWPQWYNRKRRQLKQGQHVLFIGPTQSGKTELCRVGFARQRQFVVVFGTKPVDESLDRYALEGYVRIDHWPPNSADYRRGSRVWQGDDVRFLLWPKIKKRPELRKYRAVYAKCMDEIFIEGRWCIVADEGLWLANRRYGLGLDEHLAGIAYGSASNLVSLYLLIQRPAGVPPVTWTSATWAEIFHMGRTDDIRELASLGTYEPRDVQLAVRRLGSDSEDEISHRFLDLPVRGGATWSVSEIDPAWLA